MNNFVGRYHQRPIGFASKLSEMKASVKNNSISIVIPINNEAENLRKLYHRLSEELKAIGVNYEIVFIDDFSLDDTSAILTDLCRLDPCVRTYRLEKRSGQTMALLKGLQSAKNDVIVTMDGDLQCDPVYIKSMLVKIQEGYDAVLGVRSQREDSLAVRIFSRLGNALFKWLSKTKLKDISTPYRVFKKSVLQNPLFLRKGYHRFLPIFFDKECVFYEMPICIQKRARGKSHYNASKVFHCLISTAHFLFLHGIIRRSPNLSNLTLK